jgi:hypothetical protein
MLLFFCILGSNCFTQIAKADPTTAACTTYISPTANWQYAIEAATPFSKICLNPGTYTVSSPIRVPTQVSVFGVIGNSPTQFPSSEPQYGAPASSSNVIIQATAEFQDAVFQTSWQGVNSAGKTSGNNSGNFFSGMTITSTPSRPFLTSTLSGISLVNCNWCAVYNTIFKHLNRFGVSAYGQNENNITIYNNTFSDLGQDVIPRNAIPSIYVSEVNGLSGNTETGTIWISQNLVIGRDATSTSTGNADGGVALYNSRNLSVWNNRLENVGFYSAGQVQNSSGQWIDHGNYNIAFWGNILVNTQEWAFDIAQGSSKVQVLYNNVSNAGLGSVVLSNVSDAKVIGNTFSGNRWGYVGCSGVNISGTSLNVGSLVSVQNNFVNLGPESCGPNGVVIYTPSLTVSTNTIHVPSGTGTITYNWNIPGYSSIGIWVSVDGGTPVNNTAGGTTGTGGATWIVAGHTYKFMAYPYGPIPTTLLAYDTVTAIP